MSWLFPSGGQSSRASASASVLSMNPGLISFKSNWFDLLSAKRTLKSLLQHHNSKVSILWRSLSLSSLVSQMVKNLAAMWETWVRSLGWEDPLERGMATHSSILAWRILMDSGACQATVHRVTKSGTRLSN